jgi:hypothetical protein
LLDEYLFELFGVLGNFSSPPHSLSGQHTKLLFASHRETTMTSLVLSTRASRKMKKGRQKSADESFAVKKYA